MKQFIIDNEGSLLEVVDLKEAIFQVAIYLSFLHNQPSEQQAAFALKRKIYWKDICTKLNQLRIKQSLTA